MKRSRFAPVPAAPRAAAPAPLPFLLQTVGRDPALLHALWQWRENVFPVQVGNVGPGVRPFLLALLAGESRQPWLVLFPEEAEAARAAADLERIAAATGGVVPAHFPADEGTPDPKTPSHPDIVRHRILALEAGARHRTRLGCLSVKGLLPRLPPPDRWREQCFLIRPGEVQDPRAVLARLVAGGYQRVDFASAWGEVALRGGVLDCCPLSRDRGVRVEFDGETIVSLREYDPATQRSQGEVAVCPITPATLDPGPAASATVLDYLGGGGVVVVDPAGVQREMERWLRQVGEAFAVDGERWRGLCTHRRRVDLDPAPRGKDQDVAARELHLPPPTSPLFTPTLRERLDQGGTGLFAVEDPGQARELARRLYTDGLPATLLEGPARLPGSRRRAGQIFVFPESLSRGISLPEAGVFLATDWELAIRRRAPSLLRPLRQCLRATSTDLKDLPPGAPVVHYQHGVGRYRGLKTIPVEGLTRDFMLIEYRDGDLLYQPLDRLDLVQRYDAPEGKAPRLDKLGGADWEQAKRRARRGMLRMVRELLELYAARQVITGTALAGDAAAQAAFAAGFPYALTPDQERAAAAIAADLSADRPTDRLVCGDVGYGKTEVAFRAAFQAIRSGRQVALLAPTTVLSHQHYRTAGERFRDFPVRIEYLNRFRARKEQRAILEAAAAGEVDLLIGTHRLLSKDVKFANLGLLVVDEEQRFGVKHKEQIKLLKRRVDVLTLTATPIPRTLEMALTGLREMSVIQTPPPDRYAVQTRVAVFDPEVIRTAIQRERDREGQVFFVHNRVQSLPAAAALLERLCPGARIAVAHGQMPARELERVMLTFVNGEADVLVCTTIIENGLDIPRANTILINRADTFGLAQLYQLRGRVGRADRHAYALLLTPPAGVLSDAAKKRLDALREFTALGSGFRLAARDLEIRGAGNLFGREQHGQLLELGFETYLRLLALTVQELTGEGEDADFVPTVELGLETHIPLEYLGDPRDRLYLHKRIAGLAAEEEVPALAQEITDQYGPPPAPLRNLLEQARCRIRARAVQIQEVRRTGHSLRLRLAPQAEIPPERLVNLSREWPGVQFRPQNVVQLPLPEGKDPAAVALHVLHALGGHDRLAARVGTHE